MCKMLKEKKTENNIHRTNDMKRFLTCIYLVSRDKIPQVVTRFYPSPHSPPTVDAVELVIRWITSAIHDSSDVDTEASRRQIRAESKCTILSASFLAKLNWIVAQTTYISRFGSGP